jgi:hypothetical protein
MGRTSGNVARGLWIVWAILVWNVVFDHVIVVAGRAYIAAAVVAAHGGRYARMDYWMRPAITRGLWIATGSSALILLVGFAAIRYAMAAGNRADTNPADTNPAKAGSHVPEGSHVHVRVKTDQSEGVA